MWFTAGASGGVSAVAGGGVVARAAGPINVAGRFRGSDCTCGK